ncbi:hypothetical protein EV126DRAFT_409090 [Verticillium dahliae]|nr:hypothetical protein EV126DRAFT_409090 [Verticillium dahliae]
MVIVAVRLKRTSFYWSIIVIVCDGTTASPKDRGRNPARRLMFDPCHGVLLPRLTGIRTGSIPSRNLQILSWSATRSILTIVHEDTTHSS